MRRGSSACASRRVSSGPDHRAWMTERPRRFAGTSAVLRKKNELNYDRARVGIAIHRAYRHPLPKLFRVIDLREITIEFAYNYDKAHARITIHRAGRQTRLFTAVETLATRWFRKSGYCTALIMSKIGRYMATTMPPTTMPRNTIITGSMRLSRFDTAASTSSS